MKADSRIFGKIEIEDDKIITLEKGMIGFPDLNHFALIYDEEKEKKYNSIMWLQSMDDPDIAFPVMMPHIVKEDYNPNGGNDCTTRKADTGKHIYSCDGNGSEKYRRFFRKPESTGCDQYG